MQMHKCNRGDVASSNTRAHARATTPDIPKGNNKTKQGRGGGGYEARPKAAKDRGAATCLAYVQRRRRRRRRYAAPWLSPRSSAIKKTQPASCFINSKTWYPWSGSLASRGIVTFTLAYASYRGVRSPGASRRCTVTHSVTHHCCVRTYATIHEILRRVPSFFCDSRSPRKRPPPRRGAGQSLRMEGQLLFLKEYGVVEPTLFRFLPCVSVVLLERVDTGRLRCTYALYYSNVSPLEGSIARYIAMRMVRSICVFVRRTNLWK